MLTDEATLREEITTRVQRLWADAGYRPIETPTLEVMDVLSAGKSPVSAPLKFFDGRGDLLALRPDVTLQVARIAIPSGCFANRKPIPTKRLAR